MHPWFLVGVGVRAATASLVRRCEDQGTGTAGVDNSAETWLRDVAGTAAAVETEVLGLDERSEPLALRACEPASIERPNETLPLLVPCAEVRRRLPSGSSSAEPTPPLPSSEQARVSEGRRAEYDGCGVPGSAAGVVARAAWKKGSHETKKV